MGMKITEESIYRTFEGTKQLLLGALITAITGFLIFTQTGSRSFGAYLISSIGFFVVTLLSGVVAMLFSPLTYRVARQFDIKGSKALCRIFAIVYFILFTAITTFIISMMWIALIGEHDAKSVSLVILIGCFIVGVIQTNRFFKLITE